MDVPLAIHVDKDGIQTLDQPKSHLVLQARSLRNTLNVLRRRLKMMKSKSMHTEEDVQHYKVSSVRKLVCRR